MQGIEDGSTIRAPLARDIVRIVLGTAVLLLVPLVAMQFTRQVDWGPGDFLAAGALLGVLLLGEHVTARSALSGLATLGGVAWVTLTARQA